MIEQQRRTLAAGSGGPAPPLAAAAVLTIVVPTLNEAGNIAPLLAELRSGLHGVAWEAVFVDDDSHDGTREAVRAEAAADPRVRLIHRVGRRGLSSACVEGIQASLSPLALVMDGDLQHDPALIPGMLAAMRDPAVDVVVGSRYVAQGSVGDWDRRRAFVSRLATRLGHRFTGVTLADPMSGFFMVRRTAFEGSLRHLSAVGFKILLDILASSPRKLTVRELPLSFRTRTAGESKLDSRVAIDYAFFLLDKAVGRRIDAAFLVFAAVGAFGLLIHVAVLSVLDRVFGLPFYAAQLAASLFAMLSNFWFNNLITFRDRKLRGRRFYRGLVAFVLLCSLGALPNIGVAAVVLRSDTPSWWLAGLAGAAMSLVWNYAVSAAIVWRR